MTRVYWYRTEQDYQKGEAYGVTNPETLNLLLCSIAKWSFSQPYLKGVGNGNVAVIIPSV